MLIQDRSQSKIIKEGDDSHINQGEVITYEGKKYVPFSIQGYYTDQQPIPPYDALDLILEMLSLIEMILMWIFFGQLYMDVMIQFIQLNDTIPILFNALGESTHTANKLILLAIPTIGTFFFVLLSILSLITNRFQYDLQVTPENSKVVFSNTRKLILVFKVLTMGLYCIELYRFIFLSIGSIQVITNAMNGYWMSYIVFSIFIYGIVYYKYTIEMAKII